MNADFRDLLVALSAEEAEYLVVGAYALAAHGLPRATGDLDVWVNPTLANAERVWRALQKFGAPLQDLRLVDLQTPDIVFRMGLPPSQIDVLTSITGVSFDRDWSQRVETLVFGVSSQILSRSDQIQNKRATGRPKDALDADWLERH